MAMETWTLVVANFDAGKISVLLGKGNGQFAAPVDYPVGKQPSFLLVGDVNGDGKLDVVVCNEADGTISVLLGNGDGTLQNPVTYRTVPDPVYVVMGDFNGDGKPDLAVAGNASKTIAVLLNDGTGNFSKAVPYSIGRAPRSLAVADFDGDGDFDLASANADGTISILLGRGDGNFRAISSVNVASVPLSSVVSGDFNGDGKPDLAVTQTGTKLLTVLLGKGDGTFQAGTPYTVGSNPAFAAVVDVNSDNVPDLVTANQSGNTFSVLLGNGDGTFKPSLDFTAGNSPRALATGDFNGDTRPDLAIVNFSDHTVSVPLSNGDGTFQAARAYNVDLDRKSVAAGDLDGDGKPDLVVTNFCGTDTTCASNGTVSVLLAVGDGTYKFAASYPLGAGPLSVALADVNRDKKLDLIAVNRGDKSVSVLLGNGDGTFQSALTCPAGNSPVSVAVGDFNKDGKPDLAIAGDCGSSTCSQPGEVSILLGNGDGSFQSAATYALGFSPSSIFAGDINGDANLDLVVANACGKDSSCQSNGTATVLLGDGKGGFTSGGDVQLGNSPSAVTLGDLNGDGSLDLVAAYRADNKVGVLLGNGDGTFKPQVTYKVGTAPSAVVVADFNGDGKRDVAVANFKDSKVSVLFGNGDGTLQSAVHYPVGVGPESLVAIDPNNSGRADLVTANGNGGVTPRGSDVTVLRNLAPAGLQPTFTNLTPSQMITYGTPTITLGGKICAGPQCVPMGEQVTITIQGQPPQTATISDNTGDFSTTYPTGTIPAGTYTITYSYAGDAMFNPASDNSTTLTVNPATPVFSNLAPSQMISYGTPMITLGGTICAPGGVCPPMGEQVTITIQGQPPQTATISDNTGDFSTTYPTGTIPTGTYTITYSYAGDANLNPATDSSTTLTVTQATTTTVVTAVPPSPSSYNQDIMFTATVTGANGGNPTGTVSFTADGNPIPNCTGLLLMSLKNGTGKQGSSKRGLPQGNGSAATCDVPTGLPVGQHTIQATYNGDSNYQGSSGMLQYQVNMATTTTVVTAVPPSPSSYNQDIQFTATVTGAFGGSPTGTVDFTADGTPIPNCTGLPLVSLKKDTGKGGRGTSKSQPQDGSAATCDVPTGLPVGQHTIQATYNGDSNYQGSSGMLPYQVNMATTTTVVTAVPPSPSNYNQDIQFTATVTGAFGGSPTGTVDFTADGSPIPNCTGLPLMSMKNGTGKQGSLKKGAPQDNGSAATCDVPTGLPVGQHTIQATYNGDSNYQGSSGMLPYQVNMATTTTVVTAVPPSPSSYLQDIMFTATVTGQFGGNPTGTVDFTADGAPIPNCTGLPVMSLKNGSGKQGSSKKGAPQGNGSAATCDVPTGLPVGQHTIQATYNGDSNYQGSSGMLPYQVNMATTTTVVTAVPPSPSSYLQDIMLTATVTGAFGGSPTGTVSFTSDGTPIPNCTGLPVMSLKNGTGKQGSSKKGAPQGNGSAATCDVPTGLPVGQHTIQATYSGDANYSGSFGTLPYQVNMATTTSTITPNPPSPSSYLQPVTFSVAVTGQFGGTPTGTVTFTDNGNPIPECPNPVALANGQASCSNVTSLPVGTDTIKASYSGDGNFQMSSATLTYTVNMATTATAVSAVPSGQSSYNQDITFTATVTGAFGGSPTGTVDFTADGTAIPNCTGLPLMSLKNGTGKGGSKKSSPQGNGSSATCDVPTGLAVGQHTIQATYNADSNFSGSKSSIPYTVVKANTTTAAIISPTPSSVLGQQVVITATVTGAFGGSATGSISFSYGNSVQVPDCQNPAPVSNNQAMCATRALPFGQQTVSAMYNGDGNFNLSSTPPGTPMQIVQDFVLAAQPGSATVIQSYNNNNGPFYTPQPLSATVSPRGGFGYNGTVNLVCTSVSPMPANGLTCSNVTINPASFVMGTGNATVTVSAPANTPIGNYVVTFTGQDTVDGGTPNSTALAVTIVQNANPVAVAPGGSVQTTGSFSGKAPLSNVVCSQLFASAGPVVANFVNNSVGSPYNISCTNFAVDPTNPLNIAVTIQTTGPTTSAALIKAERIFAAIWLGLPGMVFIGCLRRRKLSRQHVLRLLGMLLILVALLQGIGCGSGFQPPSTAGSTPTGFYSILVVGKDSTGAATSAVVQLTVGH